jgi:hypothetical protein
LCPNPNCSSNSYPKQIHFNPVDQAGSQSICQKCDQWFGWTDWKVLHQEDEYLMGDIGKSTNLAAPAEGLINQEPQDGKPEVAPLISSEIRIRPARSQSSTLGVWSNAILFVLIPCAALFPFLTVKVLGVSYSLNAFKGSGSEFWLTSIAVGWVVLAIAAIGLCVTVIGSLRPDRSLRRAENLVLAGLGSLVILLVFLSLFYANKQLEDAKSTAIAEAVAEGNPFASLGGAIAGSAMSIGAAIGLWLVILIAVAIIGTNFYSISQRRDSVPPLATSSGSDLVTGIRELSELRDQGIISEDEFTLAKRNLLAEVKRLDQ